MGPEALSVQGGLAQAYRCERVGLGALTLYGARRPSRPRFHLSDLGGANLRFGAPCTGHFYSAIHDLHLLSKLISLNPGIWA